jgi:hypothetical protein
MLYIADTSNSAVRVVDLTTNIITTFAGTSGTSGSLGDGKFANKLVANSYRRACNKCVS